MTESTYSYLDDIKVDGVSIADFDATKQDYTINLPIGTEVLPEISWVKGDEYQRYWIRNNRF